MRESMSDVLSTADAGQSDRRKTFLVGQRQNVQRGRVEFTDALFLCGRAPLR